MVEGSQEPGRREDEDAGLAEDVGSQGGEGQRTAGATPPIGEDAEPGQTQTPAPEDDVGVPADDDMLQPEEDEEQ
jgi:hypothetical protein